MTIGDRGYVGTGFVLHDAEQGIVIPLNDFWEYNPVTDEWSPAHGVPGSPRWNAVAFSIGSKGYLGTGNVTTSVVTGGVPVNDFYEYDPSNNTWVFKANVGDRGRHGGVGFVINGKGYVAWGSDIGAATGNSPLDQSVYEFDPNVGTSGKWTRRALAQIP